MRTHQSKLLSGTIAGLIVGAGLTGAAVIPLASMSLAASPSPNLLENPAAQPRPAAHAVQLAAGCNPCAANPCNPCAAVNPCNPCAAANPCNPCATANPCNPCAAANPCNPCAAKAGGSSSCVVPRLKNAGYNPCNPCAAANPCNPCAATNPCNPCAAANPCNPCAAAADIDITSAEASAAYECLQAEMAGYSRSGLDVASGYPGWTNVATAPYPSDTHGGRFVNNYVNATGAAAYQKYENIGTAPIGTVVAKDSFLVKPDGKTSVGPLFVMEKMAAGFNGDTGDWKYTMIMPNGAVVGVTNGKGSKNVAFCADCHNAAEDQDRLFFLPEEFRK